MKVEVYDESGNKYMISFEGRVTRDKVQKIFDIVELLGGVPLAEPVGEYPQSFSKMDKVLFIVKKNFPALWFSAKDVQETYEREVNEPISLSAVLTYLSRLAERGLLTKTKSGGKVYFKMVSQELRGVIKSP